MKKQSLLLILSLWIFSASIAQETLSFVETSNTPSEWSKTAIENKPSTDNKSDAITEELSLFKNYLIKEIRYPERSRAYNVEGTMIVRVVFDGAIKEFEIVQSLNAECDKMVERTIRTYIDNWDRSKYERIPKLTFTIPIDFKMVDL